MKNAASILQLKYKVNKLAALLLPNNICVVVVLSLFFALWQTLRLYEFPVFVLHFLDDFCAKVAIDARELLLLLFSVAMLHHHHHHLLLRVRGILSITEFEGNVRCVR